MSARGVEVAARTDASEPPDPARLAVERWLASRGVPQLVQGYADEQRLDARATPLIAAWLLLGTVLFWATRPDWPQRGNALAVALAITYLAAAYVILSLVRGRNPLRRPAKWHFADIAILAFLPVLPATVVWSPAAGFFAMANALLGIGVIYVVTAFGLPEIGWWAIRRVGSQLEQIVWLLARTLPLLLILVVFLLFAAEIWQAAGHLQALEVGVILALLATIAVLLVVTTIQPELQRIQDRGRWDDLIAEAGVTPAAALVDAVDRTRVPPPFRARERANLTILLVLAQVVQSAFVALMVALFLVAFGLVALPASVQESWVGGGIRELARFELLGEARTLSAELAVVGTLLGAITGLYFTGLALTDAAYRAEYFARSIAEIERIASVRAVYLASARTDPAGR